MAIDHFKSVAHYYGEFRPRYPTRLYELIAQECPHRGHAWDCATGSGQAAVALADIFKTVTATDASAAQLAASEAHPNITYRCAPAEASGLESESVDAITVAQALHWFPLDAFFQECGRVLKPEGILAVWTYGLMKTKQEPINAVIQHYYHSIVGPYWPPQRRLVDEAYKSIQLPFEELSISGLETNPLILEQKWDQVQLMGYLRSWSASGYYVESTGKDPISTIRANLDTAWGDPKEKRLVQWPITLRLTKKETRPSEHQ